MRTTYPYTIFVVAALFVAGCGGGSLSHAPLPTAQGDLPAQAPLQNSPVSVSVRITLPGVSTSAAQRRSQFISQSTNGVLVTVYAHADTGHTNLLGSSATDVSSGSAACGGTVGFPRTCTIGAPAPIGSDDFVIATYDAPPVAGSFSAAHQLGSGVVSNAIVAAGQFNPVNVTIGGIIASFGAAATLSAAANSSANLPVTLTASDADGQAIIIDPYGTPIAVSLTQTAGTSGGTSHVGLLVNGTNVGSSATLLSNAATLALAYDGGGGPGFFATVKLTSGSVSTTLTFNPFFMTSSSSAFVAGATSTVTFTAPGQNLTIALAEHGFTFASSNVTAPACGGIATIGAVGGNAFVVTAGASAGPCTIQVSDGLVVRAIAVGGVISSLIDATTTGDYPMTTITPAGTVAGNVESDPNGSIAVAISTATPASATSGTISSATVALTFAGTKTQSGLRSVQTDLGHGSGPTFEADVPELHPAQNPMLEQLLRNRQPIGTAAPQGAQRFTKSLPTTVGSTAGLWAQNAAIGQGGGAYTQVPATLQASTTHGYIWVDNTLGLAGSTITAIANDFENAWTSDTTHFASPSYLSSAAGLQSIFTTCNSSGTVIGSGPSFIQPGDGKIHVFVVNPASLGSGVGGYFDATNFFPQASLNCIGGSFKSNEAPMIYVGYAAANGTSFEVGEDIVRGTAHELQHLIRYVNHAIIGNQSTLDPAFLDEGNAMLAQDLAVNLLYNGNPSLDVDDAMQHAKGYLSAPHSYSLSGFIGSTGGVLQYNCANCYGLAYLFQRYLYDRFGGDTYTHANTTTTLSGWANISNGTSGQTSATLIQDFATAIAASGTSASSARYGFTSINLRHTYTDQTGGTVTLTGPASVALMIPGAATTTFTPYLGAFGYFTGTAGASGSTLKLQDQTGIFGLAGAIIQK